MTALTYTSIALVAALGGAAVIGWLIKRRSGVMRQTSPSAVVDTRDLGLSSSGPTVLHFSAVWCGPCAGVRRVVHHVVDELAQQGNTVAHVEIDMDANPEAARRLSVLSLPTTFVFDAQGQQRYRTSGVPKAADLRSALTPLLA